MEPQQQVPQQPTNQTYMGGNGGGKSSSTMKIVIVIIILLVIGLIAYFLFQTKTTVTPSDQAAIKSSSETQSDTELTQLEKENNSQDFSSVDADFGAEVNSAVQ